jgi:hypothetical protein
VRIGRWHGAENARLPVEHDVGGGHTCQQRDLCVPALDRLWGPKGERPAIALLLDLLLRDLQAHSATIAFSELAPLAHQLQQSQRLPWQASVHLGLGLVVAELRPTPHERPRHVGRHRLAAVVERDRPQQRRPYLIRQQAGGTFAQYRRVQRSPAVGRVERRAPAVCLHVDRIAGPNEGRHVSDRVGHDEAATW